MVFKMICGTGYCAERSMRHDKTQYQYQSFIRRKGEFKRTRPGGKHVQRAERGSEIEMGARESRKKRGGVCFWLFKAGLLSYATACADCVTKEHQGI